MCQNLALLSLLYQIISKKKFWTMCYFKRCFRWNNFKNVESFLGKENPRRKCLSTHQGCICRHVCKRWKLIHFFGEQQSKKKSSTPCIIIFSPYYSKRSTHLHTIFHALSWKRVILNSTSLDWLDSYGNCGKFRTWRGRFSRWKTWGCRMDNIRSSRENIVLF